ncbi:MAG: tetratricopeptide repeat protein [Myxococcales bacterium]|nr:tetratricopeptide repeat protein [Myxococcales bacterium]
MSWRLCILISMMAFGCARSATPTSTTAIDQAERDRLAALEVEVRERREAERELQSRLALARAELDRQAREVPRPFEETVRIGGNTAEGRALRFFDDEEAEGEWDEPVADLDDEDEPDDGRPRPVLRLYGAPVAAPLSELEPAYTSSDGTVPASVAAGGGTVRPWRPLPAPVPVAAVPSAPAASLGVPGFPSPQVTPAPPPTRVEPAVRPDAGAAAYERALGLLRERRVADALRAFETFLADHEPHPLMGNARYWRAESLYVLRRYDEALAAFEAYLDSHPNAGKAADALLKVGLCHERMGNRGAATRTFERLRREHPSSVAARLASREDA